MEPITFRCACCRRIRRKNPRVKKQKYCGDKRCQQARKNKWQREKLEADSDYRAGKRESQRAWREDNPDYWKQYRARHPGYCKRNRDLQHIRNLAGNVSAVADLARQDALNDFFNDNTVNYIICPAGFDVKKDALAVKIIPISTG